MAIFSMREFLFFALMFFYFDVMSQTDDEGNIQNTKQRSSINVLALMKGGTVRVVSMECVYVCLNIDLFLLFVLVLIFETYRLFT